MIRPFGSNKKVLEKISILDICCYNYLSSNEFLELSQQQCFTPVVTTYIQMAL